jgi:glyoxylase-like metal-dependent hydrolase (beta-lactamase superfamily II)
VRIIKLEVGNLGTNCYILYCENTLQAAVIDPGGNAAEIMDIIHNENLVVVCIINTHGHADHISDNNSLRCDTGAPLLIHRDDADMLTSAQLNLSMFIGGSIICAPADRLLNDGDSIEVGKLTLKVLHTPGHTPGGISLTTNDVVFSGDTLFAQSIGRTDFPGGSYDQLIQSIQNKLLALSDSTKVLPGHGPDTTIGFERQNNPFIQ